MKMHRTAAETLALCDYGRAKRTEPTIRLDKLTREQQRDFWRKPPVLTTHREQRR